MESFKPSEPVGTTDKPNSPIVAASPNAETDDSNTQAVTCTYDGKSYGKGARLCMGGKVHECGNDGWINLGKNC